MRKTMLFLFALMVASGVFAQELPFTIGCMADEDKPLEVAFCQAVFAAAHDHKLIRESTQEDYSKLALWVVTVQGDGEYVAAAVQLNLLSKSFGGAELALNTSCYIAPVDKFVLYAAVVIERAYQNAPKDLSIFAPARPPDSIRLETSPP